MKTFLKKLGVRYTDQCIHLEKIIKSFVDHLECYSCLSAQPINFSKTEALFSARAIGLPKFDIFFNHVKDEKIKWAKNFKYLGYWISPKLGWREMIKKLEVKIRQRISLIKSIKLYDSSSPHLRRMLFSSFVLPLFTWIYPLFPLLTEKQQEDLSHFYFICLRRVFFSLHWNEKFFAFVLIERSLEDRCVAYWNRYLVALADSIDGELLFEKANMNEFRKSWIDSEYSIKCLTRSKRFIDNKSIIEKVVRWLASVPEGSSVPFYDIDEIELLRNFRESFL